MFTGDEPLVGQPSRGGGASAPGTPSRRSPRRSGDGATGAPAHGSRVGRHGDAAATSSAGDIAFDPISRAIDDIAAGRPVVVVDDADRENEGDIIFAAEKATTALVAFTVRYSSGYLCVPLPGDECDRLSLPPMLRSNEDPHGTAYTVTVDARNDTTTGISARDRATTIRSLADPSATAADFTRPGHVVPLRARPGGVLERPGHTEAAVDLTRLAGLRPAGVVCEIVSEQDPTTMARTPELRVFADTHGLALISIADLAEWRRTHERLVARGPEANVPTVHGAFRAVGYTGTVDGREHVALIAGGAVGAGSAGGAGGAGGAGDAAGAGAASTAGTSSAEPVPVRIHSECLTGDVFGSLRCGCGHELAAAMDAVSAEGSGIVLYLRGDGARGEGLVHRLQALQQRGPRDTPRPAEPPAPSAQDLGLAGQILTDLGVRRVRLLTCSADDAAFTATGDAVLAAHGITVVGHRVIDAAPGTATA